MTVLMPQTIYKNDKTKYCIFLSKSQSNIVIKNSFKVILCFLFMLVPFVAHAQLSELEVSKISPDTSIPVFSNYPGMAAVEIRSSITNLRFESTWEIVAQLGDPDEGRYILIIEPVRQSLIISAAGYMQARLPLQISDARSVEYYTVEPRSRTITERGTLIVQTNPEGATIELDGVPGRFESNYTFDNILAQSYILRISMDEYQTEERLVTVTPTRPAIERIDLIHDHGFLVIEREDVRLFLTNEEDGSEFRLSYSPNEPQKIDIGNYTFRATKDGYRDASGAFEVNPDQVTRLSLPMDATFGFLTVTADQDEIELFITPEGGVVETRINYAGNAETRLPIGNYRYRAAKPSILQQEGVFNITREGDTSLNLSLEPDFGTLRVEANTARVRLTAADNEAPPTSVNNEINLESGRHIVRVEADGYVPQELRIFIEPGRRVTETVQLETVDAQQERLARESLPRGVLEISADVDADIIVNGEKRGVGEIAITLIPGTYDIRVDHPVRSKSFRATVPSAGVYNEHVYLKPKRSGAITRSVLIPGMGHTYTKRSRGYLYLAAISGAGTFAYLNHQQQQSYQDDFNALYNRYQTANSSVEVSNLRAEIESVNAQLNTTYDLKMIGLYAAAGLYLLQLTDLLITSPEYGYRQQADSRISLSAGPGGFNLQIAIH